HADMACYAAKTRGRNRFHVYEPGDDERQRMTSDVGWSRLIAQALREDGFHLLYQPIFDLHGGCAEYYEVLLRLPSAQGGSLMPESFLPVAQRFGMLADIDRWVVRHALMQLARLRTEGRDVVFSVNLSGQSFEDAGFLDFFKQEIVRNEISPSSVIFEITEQAAVRYMDRAHDLIQSLLSIGVRFALDDFGKGFSSFSYLKHLPVHFIKIDGSFVENMATDEVDQAMVRSIVQIAHALGKLTIAEHVQDESSIALLRDCGVDFLQGNLLGVAGVSFPQLPRAASWR
ncbi:MAG: EAL domain-containing protein, partial [Gammaproteobacteria bacterium]|nr:EAL domain-containing protein [Gammaproteobacteria bacterium]